MALASADELIALQGAEGIEIMEPDGANRTLIASIVPLRPSDPQWSPGGDRIVFICNFGTSFETQDICIVDRDGTNLVRLTEGMRKEFSPDWSPNGRWIAFAAGRGIYRIRINGEDEQLIPNTSRSGALGWRYNRRIVFVRGSVDSGDIYTIRPDGTGRRRLTFPHAGEEDEPQWSPDGRWIVFKRSDYYKNNVFKIRYDGARAQRLTDLRCNLYAPTWSPNGREILFQCNGLVVMDADGSDQRPVPNGEGAGIPDWTLAEPIP